MADREFVAAKDLPVTEAEKVNVLVVDPATGELAQKAGANLGGGSTQADLVIRINNSISYATEEDIEIVSGSVEAACTAYESGKFPVVEVEIVSPTNSTYIRYANKYPVEVIFYADLMLVRFIGTKTSDTSIYFCQICYEAVNNYDLRSFIKRAITTTNI